MAETREKFNLKVPFPLGLLSPLSSLSGRVTYLKVYILAYPFKPNGIFQFLSSGPGHYNLKGSKVFFCNSNFNRKFC